MLRLLLGVSLLVAAPASARKIPPCEPQPFVVTAPVRVVTPTAEVTGAEVITYAGSGSKVDLTLSSCRSVHARLKGTPTGTRVSAVFPRNSCPGVSGLLRLRATIDPGCTSWSGTLKYPKQPKKAFAATLSRCGDDRWDASTGEQCDGTQKGSCRPDQSCTSCRCLQPPAVSTTTRTTTTGTTTRTTTTGATKPSTSSTTTTFEPPECDNGIVEPGEDCEGDAGDAVCPGGSRPGGIVRCDADCFFDFDDCTTTTTPRTTGHAVR